MTFFEFEEIEHMVEMYVELYFLYFHASRSAVI